MLKIEIISSRKFSAIKGTNNNTMLKTVLVKNKIWLALFLIAAVLVSISLISIVSFSKTQQKLSQVTQQYQPKMLSAMQLTAHFYHSISVLGNYMIEHDSHNLALYQSKVQDIDKSLDQLIQLTNQNDELEDAEQLATIRSLVDKIKSYNREMLKLASDVNSNMPAVGIAATQLEPMSVEMNQLINDFILEVENLNQNQLISQLDNLRFNWTMVVSQVRNYLAFRNESTLGQIDLYMEGVEQSLQSLQQSRATLSEDQGDLLDEFREMLLRYTASMREAVSIHASKNWRADSFLMRDKITPTLRTLTTALENLVSIQKSRIEKSNADLALQIETAESTIRISIQIAFIIIVITIYLTFTTRDLLSEIRLHKAKHQVIQHKANHDELTKIPNRAFFHERLLEITKRQEQPQNFALLFIDLDGFKAVNDTAGHDAGDYILKETANRLQKLTRKTDMVSRLGGDEFIIILDGLIEKNIAETTANKVCTALHEKFLFNGKELQIGCSIGVAIIDASMLSKYTPDCESLVELVIKQADEAMYEAKKGGKNGYCVYTEKA